MKIVLPGAIHQGVLVSPANAGRVGTNRGSDSLGELARDLVHVFQHTGTRPIHVGPVLEDHIDKRQAKERLAPHILDVRGIQQ